MKAEDGVGQCSEPAANPVLTNPQPKKDIQSDIDRSVSEILALSSSSSKDETKEQSGPPLPADVALPAQTVSGGAAAVCQPSIQQLELLELEMRARAIKALMKASNGKKPCLAKNT